MTTFHSTYARTLPHLSPESYPPLTTKLVPQNQIYVPRKTGLEPLHELILGIFATHALQHAGLWQPMLFTDFMHLARRAFLNEGDQTILKIVSTLQKQSLEIIHIRIPEECSYIFPMPRFVRIACSASVWELISLSTQSTA